MLFRILHHIGHNKEIKVFNRYYALLRDCVEIARLNWKGNREDYFMDAFFILANKMVVDMESVILLLKSGKYGSCYTLCASATRTRKMLVALQADPSIREMFINEDRESYQEDQAFKKAFTESSLSKKIKFWSGSGEMSFNEFDKLLHGSAFASRKFYCDVEVDSRGQRAPVLPFGSIYDSKKASDIILYLQALCLDTVGIFLEEYKHIEIYNKIKERYLIYLRELGIKV